MIKTSEHRIGNHTYRITQLPVSKGRPLLVRLTRVLGPVVAELLRDGEKLSEAGAGAVAGAIRELATRLTDEDLSYVCDALAEHTEVSMGDGKWVRLSGVFELHFAGAYDEMLKWIGAGIEANYRSFFSGLTSGSLSFGGGPVPSA